MRYAGQIDPSERRLVFTETLLYQADYDNKGSL